MSAALLAPPTRFDLATRREFLALLGAAGLLTGCATDPTTPDRPATRTIETANGPVEIPVDPQRVATTFYPFLIALAMLGVPLVATARQSFVSLRDFPAEFVPPGFDGLTDIGEQDSPDLETNSSSGSTTTG